MTSKHSKMSKETQLITVPSFVFDNGTEIPIQVNYYNGSIELRQAGNFDTPETIMLDPSEVKSLIKAIIKHQPEANEWLNRKP